MAHDHRSAENDPAPVVDRREALLKILRLAGLSAGTAASAYWLSSRSARPTDHLVAGARRDHTVAANPQFPDLAVIHDGAPAPMLRRALQEMGGMQRFVSRGDIVIVKPNIAWDRTPAQAANTNPELVAELVLQCWSAGAKKVIVTDVSCNDPRRCFERSGIAAAARQSGAEVLLPAPEKFKEVDLGGDLLQAWPVYQPFLEADKIINVPIAKHHSLTGCTLGMKNWYGILGGQRHRLHQRIHESLADLADFVRPTLTVLDAYRVLVRNGPTGGNLEDVLLKKTLVAGTDPVALDAYVAKAYWNLEPAALPYLKMAVDRGLGSLQFENLRTQIVSLDSNA